MFSSLSPRLPAPFDHQHLTAGGPIAPEAEPQSLLRLYSFEGRSEEILMLRDALRNASGEDTNLLGLTQITPHLVFEPDVSGAVPLLAAAGAYRGAAPHPFQPELWALLANPYLSGLQKGEFARQVLSSEVSRSLTDEQLVNLSEHLGRYGIKALSFHLWRYPAITIKEGDVELSPALFQQAGMVPLRRVSDRVASPDGVPLALDLLGSAFVSLPTPADTAPLIRRYIPESTYIEYRRVYVAVNDGEGCVVIKNSNRHFGRDRLKHVAYVSHEPLTSEQLQALDQKMLEDPRIFLPVDSPELYRGSAARNLTRQASLLSKLDAFELGFSQWLFPTVLDREIRDSSGISCLVKQLAIFRSLVDRGGGGEASRISVPRLGLIHPDFPAWFPHGSLRIDSTELHALDAYSRGADLVAIAAISKSVATFIARAVNLQAKLALMSGPRGDYPK